jgi:hypothetical protein
MYLPNLRAMPIVAVTSDIIMVRLNVQVAVGFATGLQKIVMITIFVVPCMHVGDTIMNAEMLIVKPRIQDALLRDVLM